jgi:hypothetical protein
MRRDRSFVLNPLRGNQFERSFRSESCVRVIDIITVLSQLDYTRQFDDHLPTKQRKSANDPKAEDGEIYNPRNIARLLPRIVRPNIPHIAQHHLNDDIASASGHLEYSRHQITLSHCAFKASELISQNMTV